MQKACDNAIHPTTNRVLGSYMLSVTVGVTCLVAAFWWQSPLTGHGFIQGAFFTGLIFTLTWIFGVLSAAVPCALVTLLARAFAVKHPLFYLLVGVSIGIALIPVFVCVFNSTSWYTDPPDQTDWTMRQAIKNVGMAFGLAGGVAGLTYWRMAGRFYR
jgi:magnesium-transporting ATPase (P-type)